MSAYNVLICDDDADIVNALKIYLQAEDYGIFCAASGKEALECIHNHDIHLVLLDIMMPGMNGLEALSKIREFSNVPVLFLTAKGEDADIILGLSLGADDYITKPFLPAELLARVRSGIRRYTQLGGMAERSAENIYTAGGIELDDLKKQVTLDGEQILLTKTEYEILKFLMQHPGRVFSPQQIYRAVWNESYMGSESTVAVHIRHLREKLEYDPAKPRIIKVVWGHGYMIENEKKG
ncbi:MAG: response regulator transcription factor [Lachnospiraceae bacterium]|nr:response regulator transcription factor [Lachnospiraceae bacterium]